MKKAKIGLLGCGRMGYHHGANMAYRCPNIELVGVYDPNPQAAEKASHDFETKVYESEDALLNSKELDGVVIASSTDLHCTHIIKALEANKHVFVEKPISDNLADLPSIYNTVNKNKNRIFQVGYYKRYDAEYRYARQKVKEGLIGEPILIKLQNRDPEAPPKEFMHNSAGIFLDLAVHELDTMRWFLESEPKVFYTMGGIYRYDFMEQFGDIDTATISVQMQNDTLALIDISRNAIYANHIETEIFGTEGSIRIGTINKNSCVIYRDKKRYNETGPWFLEKNEKAYWTEVLEFADHIINETRPEATALDAIRVTQMAIAAKESYEKKTPIIFDTQELK